MDFQQKREKQEYPFSALKEQHSNKLRSNSGKKLPLCTIRLASLRRFIRPNPREFDGWALEISYKFNKKKDDGNYYYVMYSDVLDSETTYAFLKGSSPFNKQSLAKLRTQPSNFVDLPQSILLSSNEGIIIIYFRKDSYPNLKPGMGTHIFLEATCKSSRNIPIPFGVKCSNIMVVPSLPK